MADVWYLPSLPFLQITADPVFVQDDQLIQHLVPVAVSLCPFLRYILAYQVQHFSRDVSLGNTLLVLVTLRYWRFSSSMMFVVYMIRRMSCGNWKKGLTFPVVFYFSSCFSFQSLYNPLSSVIFFPFLSFHSKYSSNDV